MNGTEQTELAGASDQTKRGQKRAPIPTKADPHSLPCRQCDGALTSAQPHTHMHTDE